MKQVDVNHYKHVLQDLAQEMGVTLSDAISGQLLTHLELLLEENKVHNLTRITEIDEALILHIIDSLLLTHYFPFSNQTKHLDIGSGGGYPGIPIALVGQSKTTLIDSVQKKVHFLNKTIRALELESHVNAIHAQVEDFSQSNKASFDCITARAVAPLEIVIEYAAPLLSQGGVLLVSQGPQQIHNITDVKKVLDLCGMEEVSRETIGLPLERGSRTIIKFNHTQEPKINLPRKTGMARKRPLYKLKDV